MVKKMSAILVLLMFMFALTPLNAFASTDDIENLNGLTIESQEVELIPEDHFQEYIEVTPVSNQILEEQTFTNEPDSDYTTSSTYVAELTIFSSHTSSDGDSSSDYSGHSWITIKNISSSNINVGVFSGIAPTKQMSVGTWGNKNDNNGNLKKGLWYNLEAYILYHYPDAYNGRVSLTMNLTQADLDKVNTFIRNNDSWGYYNNCANFASKLWNEVSSTKLDAGSLPPTPKKLYDSIKSKSGYKTNVAVPWHYVVYYANGTGTATKSDLYN